MNLNLSPHGLLRGLRQPTSKEPHDPDQGPSLLGPRCFSSLNLLETILARHRCRCTGTVVLGTCRASCGALRSRRQRA